MLIENNSKRLICLQTKEGRVDLLPGVATDDARIDSLKDDKVFNALLDAGDLKEAKAEKKTPKELLVEEAEGLGIDTTDMTKAELETAIEEAGE